jgi:hypothetical protein
MNVNALNKISNAFHSEFDSLKSHKPMLLSEAKSSIVRIAARCMNIPIMIGKNVYCGWSDIIIKSSHNLKDDLLTEYAKHFTQYFKEKRDFKNKYPTTTLTQMTGYKEAVEEEFTLFQMIQGYTRKPILLIDRKEEIYCKISIQAAKLAACLIGMASSNINAQVLMYMIKSSCQLQVSLAKKTHLVDIINQLSLKMTSLTVMVLSTHHLYTISYEERYMGFIFLDSPVHLKGDKIANISYIEVLPEFRKASFAKRMLHQIKTMASSNDYQYLKASPSNSKFWLKCGFKIVMGEAVLNLNPMSMENILN